MSETIRDYEVTEKIMPHGIDERADERLARLEHLEILREHLDFDIYSATNRLAEVSKEIEAIKASMKGETNATRPN